MAAIRPLPQVAVAQLGARMHYAVPVLLHRAGMLAHFYTDAYVGPGSWLHWGAKLVRNLVPPARQPQALARALGRAADLPAEKITAFNRLGWSYARKLRQAPNDASLREVQLWGAKRFAGAILQDQARLSRGQAIYAYNGAGLELFSFGAERGLKLILDQINPSLYEAQLVAAESSLWPGWEKEPAKIHEDEMMDREKAEWSKADLILVNSEFSRTGLVRSGAAPGKIRVVPLAVDTRRFYPPPTPRRPDRIKFLFLGTVGLRKGIQYCLEAFRLLKDSHLTLTVAGGLDGNFLAEKLREYSQVCDYLGSIPRPKILDAYHGADVLVFPTISDGFGLVQLEALACGLPVITTPNCGSLVRDGIDGFVIPIRDVPALAEKIALLAQDSELRTWMSHNARQRALAFDWQTYGARLGANILSLWESPEHLEGN
jgi:glycosyltransferase involved in cell wall biosynthesis